MFVVSKVSPQRRTRDPLRRAQGGLWDTLRAMGPVIFPAPNGEEPAASSAEVGKGPGTGATRHAETDSTRRGQSGRQDRIPIPTAQWEIRRRFDCKPLNSRIPSAIIWIWN